MTNNQKKQNQRQSLKKCRFILFICAGLIFSLSLTKLLLSNRAATWGQELEEIQLTTSGVKKRNQELLLTLKQKNGSLAQLQEQAQNLGFVDKPQYLYLSPNSNVAQKLP